LLYYIILMKQLLLNFINKGSERSIRAKKNVLSMLFIKGGSILVGLLLVPLTLEYVDSESYGIWLTLSSMVAWISFFDIGINNGLKNKLAESLALKNYELGQKYVSTTYAILSLIFIPLMFLLLIATHFIDWCAFLNLPDKYADSLVIAVSIIITYFCINFILSTINIVILAEQRPADESLRVFLQQLTSLIIIFILVHTTQGNLIYLCCALCISPLAILTIFNITLFKGRYKNIAPRIKQIDFKLAPDLLKLGFQFFVIQIAAIIQYQMINFLILRYYGASDVTSYNIANKYFNIILMVWGILTTPIWVAVTDAITHQDYNWIRRTKNKFLVFFGFAFIIGIAMLIISNQVYNIWVGSNISVPITLSFWVLIYNLVLMFGSIYVSIINGSGKLKIQFIASIISPFIFLAVLYLFIEKMHMGIHSILIAAIIANFNGLILAPLQCRHILKHG